MTRTRLAIFTVLVLAAAAGLGGHGAAASALTTVPRDIVIGVNRHPVNDMEEFAKLTQGSGDLLLHIRRGEGALFLLVQ